jgi:hypothetical protein
VAAIPNLESAQSAYCRPRDRTGPSLH